MKIENERFSVAYSRCRQNIKFGDLNVVVMQRTSKICAKIRAARVAR